MGFLSQDGESEFPVNKNKVFEAMQKAIPRLSGMKIENVDKLLYRITIRAGQSILSLGQSITIQLTEVAENKTKIQILSSAVGGLFFVGVFDAGKNRKNIEDILAATSKELQGIS